MTPSETALFELGLRIKAIGPQPCSRTRQALRDAFANFLRVSRLHGPDDVSVPTPAEAVERVRAAVQQALQVGADRRDLVIIFNGEEDAAEAVRRDFR